MKKEHPLINIIKDFPRVAKLKMPSEKQCEILYQQYHVDEIIYMLGRMENYRQLTRYTTVYFTISHWLNSDKAKAQSTGRVITNDLPEMITGERLKENRTKIKPGWLIKNVRKRNNGH